MSNYYLTRRLTDEDYSWATQLHIAKKGDHGIMLQAIIGYDGPRTPQRTLSELAGTLVYSQGLIPSIQSWEGWKQVLQNPALVILDEHNMSVDADEFIELVETQAAKSAPYHHQIQWCRTTETGRLMVPIPEDHYFLDGQGYSFAWSEFH